MLSTVWAGEKAEISDGVVMGDFVIRTLFFNFYIFRGLAYILIFFDPQLSRRPL